jgi:uncharacterized membrane protein
VRPTACEVGESSEGADGASLEAMIESSERDRQPRSGLQRLVDGASDRAGRPGFALALFTLPALWIAYNLAARRWRLAILDPAPFAWLELIATVVALLLAGIIIATQRREDRLAERRAQLTLELAVRAERKSAKIIQLLEEIRRDSPHLANRIDPESDSLSTPSDPNALLRKIDADSGRSAP